MGKFLVIALALYGGYYYISTRYEFHDTLVYAQKNPKAPWAGPVQYYVGLVYYQRADYPKAQDAFSQLLKNDPTGYYTPRALVKLDDVAEYNHDWNVARDALQRYVDEFPDGKDIEIVRKRLEMVNYQHPATQ